MVGICAGMTVDHEGRIFAIDGNGMPRRRSGFSVPLPRADKIIVMVNGFDFDPTEESEDNPHQTLFRDWSGRLSDDGGDEGWQCFGFGWYSAELEPQSWLGGLIRGHWNPYRWGWELSEKAGGILAQAIDSRVQDNPEGEVCIIAHSMGARVALCALGQLECGRVSRALLLNGSEYSQTAKRVACYTACTVLNVVVESDDVLDKPGSVFAPEAFIDAVVGQKGLCEPPENWLDFRLDDEDVRSRAAKAEYEDLQGDNPERIADHWYSYTHEPNWDLFKDFIFGERHLADLRPIAEAETNGAA